MRSVGIKVLKNKLSEYIRIAEAGETVLITDRDRVVAELSPPRAQQSPLLDNPVLAELVRRGLLTPAVRPFTGQAPRGKPVLKLDVLLRELDEDRADRVEVASDLRRHVSRARPSAR
jgi:antitoxin (DNA-binding transcriptional repressor) of toxin-antitoxin stability system